jgi:hypothetical protein
MVGAVVTHLFIGGGSAVPANRCLGETHERIHQDRESGRPGSIDEAKASRRVVQIKVGKVKLWIRALKDDNTEASADIHSSEEILEAFEYAGADDVERRIVEQNPSRPVFPR